MPHHREAHRLHGLCTCCSSVKRCPQIHKCKCRRKGHAYRIPVNYRNKTNQTTENIHTHTKVNSKTNSVTVTGRVSDSRTAKIPFCVVGASFMRKGSKRGGQKNYVWTAHRGKHGSEMRKYARCFLLAPQKQQQQQHIIIHIYKYTYR